VRAGAGQTAALADPGFRRHDARDTTPRGRRDAVEVCSLIPAADERHQVGARGPWARWAAPASSASCIDSIVDCMQRRHPDASHPTPQCFSVFGLDADKVSRYYDLVVSLEGSLHSKAAERARDPALSSFAE